MTHALKTWTVFFQQVKKGLKNFELRKNDRDFKEGDRVLLQEWDFVNNKYTGDELEFRIGYILDDAHGHGFGLKKGYVIFSLVEIQEP